jgi:hypothetical protein
MGETSTTRGQLTINISGLYDVYAQVRWGSNASGKRNLRISKNLGNDPDIVAVAEQAVDTTRQFVSRSRVWLETGDILTMEVLQTSGSSQSLAPTTTAPIYMHIEYLGDEEF